MTGSIFLDSSEYGVNETADGVSITIRRTGDSSGAVNVTYQTTAITATEGSDFVGVTAVALIPIGADHVTVTIPILDDLLSEATEQFSVSIVDTDSGNLFFPRTSIVNIYDNENPVADPPIPPLTSDYTVVQETVAAGLDQPISFVWSPTDPNLMYIAEKGGVIRVFDTTTETNVSTFIDISAQTNNSNDRGLLDIVLDPNFPTRPYLYAFYTVDPPETAGLTGNAGPDGGGNRFGYVVRFEADPATGYTTVLAGAEAKILVGGAGMSLTDISGDGEINSVFDFTIPASDIDPATGEYIQNYIKVDSSTHMGGTLEFGPDGMLYVGIGDGSSFDAPDPRAVGTLDVDSLAGKILRIDPDTGLGLPDNPFVDGQPLDDNSAKVWMMGLRNPYTMAFAPDGRLFMSETGWFSWEEINAGGAGANFGWPYFEGGDNGVVTQAIGYNGLPGAAAYYAAVASGTIEITPAVRAFSHLDADPGFAVKGIVGSDSIFTADTYSSALQNSYFFTDVVTGDVFALNIDDPADVQFLYNTGFGFGPVHFEMGPDGYMYYANLFGGSIGRLLIEPVAPLFVANGSAATDEATGGYTLTDGAQFQSGNITSGRRIDLANSFQIAFEVSLGDVDEGGDGLAFFLHNDPRANAATGSGGSNLGVTGISNLFGLEIDTYDSGTGDIAADHTNYFSLDPLTGGLTAPVALAEIEDGVPHTVTIDWDPVTKTISYSIDGAIVGSLQRDIADLDLGGSQFAYFGLAAGTGFSANAHSVEFTSIDAIYESTAPVLTPLPDRPLPGFVFNGAAAETGSDILTLTPDLQFQAGTAMAESRVDLSSDFLIAFRAYLGANDAGADGLGFVLHNDARGTAAIGGEGGALGLRGIENGLAIALNTFGDDSTFFFDTDAAFATTAVGLENLEDGLYHDVLVTWSVADQKLTYFVDDVKRGEITGDISNDYLGGATLAYFGFGAGTGSDSNVQRVEFEVANGTFEFGGSGLTPDLTMNGTASFDAVRSVHTLTPDQPFSGGNVTSTQQIDLNYDFTIDFSAFFGVRDGADGIAFALHNDVRGAAALGDIGGSYGIKGIADGIGLEFDTWFNAETGFDIPSDHLSFFDTDIDSLVQTAPQVAGELADLAWHDVSISWSAATQTLSYVLDGSVTGSLTEDIVATYLGGSTLAHFAIGGGTGGATNLHEIRVNSVDAVFAGQQPGNAPTLAAPLVDQMASAGVAFDYTVPAGTFTDPDADDVLTLTATLSDGSALPTWLAFVDGRFSGTPETSDTTILDVQVTATDATLLSASDVFTLAVDNPAGGELPVFVTNGSAAAVGEGYFTLTPDSPLLAGSAMSSVRIDVTNDFRIGFDIFAGENGGGSDGLAFVLHNAASGAAAVGDIGGGLGYLGIDQGLAIEFDTFDNGIADGDINANHSNFAATSALGAFQTAAIAVGDIEDGAWHRVVVDWKADTLELSYTVDGSPVAALQGAIDTMFLGGSSAAVFGFTAATGGSHNLQEVRITEFDALLADGTTVDYVNTYSDPLL